MTTLRAGAQLWIPCEIVARGPFSDERAVLVEADGEEWSGFVNVRWLKDGVEKGADQVLARVVEVEGQTFHARIPGDALQGELFEGRVARAKPVGRVEEVVHHGPLQT